MNAQIPPEIMALLEQMTSGGEASLTDPLLAQQYETAGAMRGTPMPEMRRYGANHVVGPNPMEFAAAAIQRYRGGQGQADAMAQMRGNAGTQAQAFKAAVMAEMLRRKQEAPPTAPGQSFMGDPSGAFPGP